MNPIDMQQLRNQMVILNALLPTSFNRRAIEHAIAETERLIARAIAEECRRAEATDRLVREALGDNC